MTKRYAVAIAAYATVSVRVVEAASERDAVVAAIKDWDGFEEWDWGSFQSFKSLERELSECDIHVDTQEIV